MTSFGWKRKAGEHVSKASSNAFLDEAKDDEDEAITSGQVDWLTLVPQKKAMVLEDAVAKSNRLKEEGVVLAENDRFWEALRKWDQALQLTPGNEKLMDMRAQAYLQLNELYPAVQAAEKTLDINPLWWVAHQTLGRARLGLGEVRMALKCFSRAVHLNPDDPELWKEDLMWSAELVARKKVMEQEALAEAEAEKLSIVELKPEAITETETQCTEIAQSLVPRSGHVGHGHSSEIVKDCHSSETGSVLKSKTGTSLKSKTGSSSAGLETLPNNYVVMRD